MTSQSLSDAERRAWLRLARTQNVGPSTFAQLLARFGTAAAAIDEVPRLARRGGANETVRIPSDNDAANEIERLGKLGGRVICACEGAFPRNLAAIDPPPPVISVLGRTDFLASEM